MKYTIPGPTDGQWFWPYNGDTTLGREWWEPVFPSRHAAVRAVHSEMGLISRTERSKETQPTAIIDGIGKSDARSVLLDPVSLGLGVGLLGERS